MKKITILFIVLNFIEKFIYYILDQIYYYIEYKKFFLKYLFDGDINYSFLIFCIGLIIWVLPKRYLYPLFLKYFKTNLLNFLIFHTLTTYLFFVLFRAICIDEFSFISAIRDTSIISALASLFGGLIIYQIPYFKKIILNK